MIKLLSLVSLVTLAGCSGGVPTEQNGMFFNGEQTRFKVSRERTPINFPDLFVIRDALFGTDYLVVRFSDQGVTMTRLEGGGGIGSLSTNWSKAYFLEK